MAGRLERWINKAFWRRCNREELNDFLADHFTGEISEDEELSLIHIFREGHYRDQPVLDMVLKDLRRGDKFSCGRVTVIDQRGQRNRLALSLIHI